LSEKGPREETTMPLANILVHVDSRPRTTARLALAVRIAERTGARLTGLFAEKADAYRVGTVATWPSPHYTASLEAARGAFSTATAALGDRAAFMDTNRGSDLEIGRRFVSIARTFDLVILGQTQDEAPAPAKLPEQVIVESGRPVLVVPYVGLYPDVGSRPLFGWRSSRAAARAIFDAMALLKIDCEALVVEVGRKNEERDEFADLLVATLAAHDVAARYEHTVADDEIAVMDVLLSAIADHSADLLAMGAFDSGMHALLGHGAGTRHILAHMTAPVLFSH
jgi:nucleotide-binding universal stress UspA family protein